MPVYTDFPFSLVTKLSLLQVFWPLYWNFLENKKKNMSLELIRIRILLFTSLTFKTPTKNYFFLLITFGGIITSFLKDKMS